MLELLMRLYPKKYTTSSEIREYYQEQDINTYYSRLNRLVKKGYVKKLNRKQSGRKMIPGGDKTEYMLTKDGVRYRKQLIEKATKILTIDRSVKKTLLKELSTKDANVIGELIREFSSELKESLDRKDLDKIEQRLNTLILERLF